MDGEAYENAVKRLKALLKESKNAVFFGGAGVSTESGIKDFRSENGIYNTVREYGIPPEEIISHSFFLKNPKMFYDFYGKYFIAEGVEPNDAHRALAKLEEEGVIRAVITQNVDGLHQAAGSKNVIELHGSVLENYCTKCGASYPYEKMVKNAGQIPYCEKCGAIVKPKVVLYEEALDGRDIENAVNAIESADLLIIGGTSLAVYPAAGLINAFRGKELVLINRDETPADRRATLVIHEKIGKVFRDVMAD